METMLPSAASIVIQQRSVGGHLRPEADVLTFRFSAPNRAADTSAMTKAGAGGPVSPNQQLKISGESARDLFLVDENLDPPILTPTAPAAVVIDRLARAIGKHPKPGRG